MESEEKKISKYSSGVNILIRLDSLWKDAHLHSRNGLFLKWNSDLDCIWSELARDFEEKDYNKEKEKLDELDKKISELGKFEDSLSESLDPISKEEVDKRDKQYKVLREKQLFLARLENKLGKGTTYNEGDESDWE